MSILTPEQVAAMHGPVVSSAGHGPTCVDDLIRSHEALRETVARLNRRAQSAESGLAAALAGHERDGPSFGRTLANAAAAMYRDQAEAAQTREAALVALLRRLTILHADSQYGHAGQEITDCPACQLRDAMDALLAEYDPPNPKES